MASKNPLKFFSFTQRSWHLRVIYFCEDLQSYLWRLRTIFELSISTQLCAVGNENDYQWSHLMFQSCRKMWKWVNIKSGLWGRVGTIVRHYELLFWHFHPFKTHSSIMNGIYDRLAHSISNYLRSLCAKRNYVWLLSKSLSCLSSRVNFLF